MTIHQKLERLLRFSSKTAVSRAAGLGASTLGAILARKSDISVNSASSLACVLEVDAAWLMDDSAGWPVVPARERKNAEAVA